MGLWSGYEWLSLQCRIKGWSPLLFLLKFPFLKKTRRLDIPRREERFIGIAIRRRVSFSFFTKPNQPCGSSFSPLVTLGSSIVWFRLGKWWLGGGFDFRGKRAPWPCYVSVMKAGKKPIKIVGWHLLPNCTCVQLFTRSFNLIIRLRGRKNLNFCLPPQRKGYKERLSWKMEWDWIGLDWLEYSCACKKLSLLSWRRKNLPSSWIRVNEGTRFMWQLSKPFAFEWMPTQ